MAVCQGIALERIKNLRSYFALRLGVVLVVLLAGLAAAAQSALTPYEAVDPLIGTTGGGNTFPGASLPFGMMQWSPDTNHDAWYIYGDKQIMGFGLTHVSGAGCGLYGDFAVLPVSGVLTTSPGTKFDPYAVGFDHSKEESHPGYYAVTLANGVRVEITTSERAGIARFIFPEGSAARLLVNAGSSANTIVNPASPAAGSAAYGNRIELNGASSYAGSVAAGGFCGPESHYKLYVAGSFNKPYKKSAVWQDDTVSSDSKSAQGKHTGAWLDFGNEREVVLKVGISFVSEEGAHNNLEKEITGWNFDEVRAKARSTWSELLSRIAVEGGTADQRKIFYTGFYHNLLSPTLFSDEDGKYIGFDQQVRSLAGSKQKAQYADFSDWDIYRNTVQLQALFEPARESDMMQSLVNDAEQSGWYPRWPAANDVTYVMDDDAPVILIAESYAFGARNFDQETALKYMVKAGTDLGLGPRGGAERRFLAEYRKLGYVPFEKFEDAAASLTLEYASSDFAVAQFAKSLGHQDEYKAFMKQSENWKNLLDPASGWIRPRLSDGTWLKGFDADGGLPKKKGTWDTFDQQGFEEGNTYQYTYMIPFDYPALFAAVGGEDKVIPRLDKFFLKLRCWGDPCYNIENEPDFVVPYAYDFAGQPWKAQEVVTRIGKETFKTTPDGIPGNDDLGATSGVYVWNALGFYPSVPGVGGLTLGTPMFEKATLRLAGGRTLVISRKGEGIYVQKVALDDKPYTSTWLPIEKVHAGTTEIQFTNAGEPNKQYGSAPADRPPSFR
jgi:predicted alpha-1,2-mannosidase